MPLWIFRIRLVSAANFVAFLHSGGLYGSFLLLTLYMQQVLHLSVLETGLAFLATAGTAVIFAGPAQALATRVGVKPVMLVGIGLLVLGMLWYTQISPDGSYPVDLLPGFLAVGIGIPFSYIPITIAALAGVGPQEAGLASGLLNTSQQVGGAIGTAVLSTVAFTHADTLLKERNSPEVAFTEGFQWAFWVGFGIWTAAFLAALVFIRREEVSADAAEMAMG
jgi:Na+/melibiose symporter-like transporter